MGIRFFPKTEIHEFEYLPLFYDEVKDRIEQRRAEIRAEIHGEQADNNGERTRYIKKGTFTRRLDRKHEETGRIGAGAKGLLTFRNVAVAILIYICIKHSGPISDYIASLLGF